MNCSWDGIKFICRREALVRVAYHDGDNKDGSPKYSIGFGSQNPIPKPGDTITNEEAFKRMIAHIEGNDEVIERRLDVAVKQCEWDALSSLFYQAGSMALLNTTRLFNIEVNSIWGILEFARWHHDNPGIARRRAHEMAMASEGYYGELDTYFYYDGDPRTTDKQAVPFPAQPMRPI